jgi:hypothetical protein
MNENFALTKKTDSLIAVDPAAVAAAEAVKARIQAAYIMALQKPRDENFAREKILEACKRPEFAERVEFKRQQGMVQVNGKWEPNYIYGPSIRFAELALKEWGNVLTETSTLYEDEIIRRVKVSVLDLETNAAFSKELQIKKTVERKKSKGRDVVGERLNSYGDKVFIVIATDEEVVNKENALVSKAVRNEGLRLIPSDLKDEAILIARETIANRFKESPNEATEAVINGFATLSISSSDIEKYLGHKIDKITAQEVADLRGVYRAIRDGESTWQSYTSSEDSENEPPMEKGSGSKHRFDNEIGVDPKDADLVAFLKVSAVGNNMSVDEVKELALDDMESFKSHFIKWRAEQRQKKSASAGSKKKDPDDPELAFIDEWTRLQKTGFKPYVEENLDLFRSCSETTLHTAKAKWGRLYGDEEPWPGDVSKMPDSEVVYDPRDKGESPEGCSKGEGEIVDSGGSEEVENQDDGAIWKELLEIKDNSPSYYLKVTQGNSPKSVSEAKKVLAGIKEMIERDRLQQSGGIPSA